MKIVIDLPEKDYIALRDCHAMIGEDLFNLEKSMARAIKNGVPLSKGHGDLIDRNDLIDAVDTTLLYHFENGEYLEGAGNGYEGVFRIADIDKAVYDAPIVIPADK